MPPIAHVEFLAPYQRIIDGEVDPKADSARLIDNPIGVGAVGGSGTRLIAQVLTELGVAMATPINRAGDALEWPPFKAILNSEANRGRDRATLIASASQAFETFLDARRQELGLTGRAGWKVPGTFHWLRDLNSYFPRMQYIHLMRNGLDMAYSGNQEQAANWGPQMGLSIERDSDGRITPASMLEYWLTANEQALAEASECLGERCYLLRFEQLCAQPRQQMQQLREFLQLPASEETVAKVAAMVHPPKSVGRYRELPWQTDFTDEQLRRLEALGYAA